MADPSPIIISIIKALIDNAKILFPRKGDPEISEQLEEFLVSTFLRRRVLWTAYQYEEYPLVRKSLIELRDYCSNASAPGGSVRIPGRQLSFNQLYRFISAQATDAIFALDEKQKPFDDGNIGEESQFRVYIDHNQMKPEIRKLRQEVLVIHFVLSEMIPSESLIKDAVQRGIQKAFENSDLKLLDLYRGADSLLAQHRT